MSFATVPLEHGLGLTEERTVPPAPRWLNRGRVPCLDGLRAVAILLVLMAHASKTHGFPFADDLRTAMAQGGVGVQVFFVISGFLITLLLLRERQKTGEISVYRFYQRRCLRILPAYIAFLLALAGLTLVGTVDLGGREWLGALTYTVNWIHEPDWKIGHLWSLSLEEHFYLLWPLLLWLSPRWARGFAWACIVVMPVARLVFWMCWQDTVPVEFCTLTRLDGIAVGCVLAFLVQHPRWRGVGLWATRRAAWLGPLAILVLASSMVLSLRWYHFHLLLGYSFNAAAIAVLIWLCITREKGPLGRVLESRPLLLLGTLSYSIYLWQQVFLNPHNPGWVCRWPVNLGFAFLAAAASYVFIEAPFLRLKERAEAAPLARAPASAGQLLLGKDA
jgi:peptidoglycan/LPS O-acetylase OafA/YrhL